KDRKFKGIVTEVANSSTASSLGGSSGMGMSSSQQQEATKFSVKIRIKEKEAFRPGMSVTAEIETRSRTNVLAVPIASVTTRLPKEKPKQNDAKTARLEDPPPTNSIAGKTNSPAAAGTNTAKADKKSNAPPKPV